jgi:isochorismate hydrolase
MFPSSPLVKRNGEVNAWDNSDFRNAIKATGKKQLIVAGITTDVSESIRLRSSVRMV